ncbi:hypothetical protein GJ496_010578 [Pomphorhynchus laevis]|nr:hypothetical protein GJ496_010578 [Pomphorhynchus laevis]
MTNQRILSIIHSEFHTDRGPVIIMETEKSIDYIKFADIQSFIIPSINLKDRLLILEKANFRLIGCLRAIENKKYQRNTFMFNTCLLVTNGDNLNYNAVLIKLSRYLLYLETHFCFLSNPTYQGLLRDFLNDVHTNLNKEDTVHIKSDVFIDLHLKLIGNIKNESNDKIGHIAMCNVPVAVHRPHAGSDLVEDKILNNVDGINNIDHITKEAKMDLAIGKCAIRRLIGSSKVYLVPAFQYFNQYMTTSKIIDLVKDHKLQKAFVYICHRDNSSTLPSFRIIFQFLSCFSGGASVKDIVLRLMSTKQIEPNGKYSYMFDCLDERRCVQFAVMLKILRHLKPFICSIDNPNLFDYRINKQCDEVDLLSALSGMCLNEIIEFIDNDLSREMVWL